MAVVHNANGRAGSDLGPIAAIGAPFGCAALASGNAAEGGLVQAFPAVQLETVGNVVVAAQFFAGEPLPPTSTPVPTRTPSPVPSCIGDCDSSGAVTVEEIITMVNIVLGNAPLGACPAGACDPQGAAVDITCIVRAVGYALGRCPMPPPTATPLCQPATP
jgi:hypothetical protein